MPRRRGNMRTGARGLLAVVALAVTVAVPTWTESADAKASPKVAPPVKAWLIGEGAALYRPQVEALFRLLHDKTGAGYDILPSKHGANMTVWFMHTDELRRRLDKPSAHCGARFDGHGHARAVAYIGVDDPLQAERCLNILLGTVIDLPDDVRQSLAEDKGLRIETSAPPPAPRLSAAAGSDKGYDLPPGKPAAPSKAIAAATAKDWNGELPPAEALLDHFRNVVFFVDEGGRGQHPEKPMVRWSGPVKVWVAGKGNETYREPLEALLTELSDLTGLPFRVQPGQEGANFKVLFMPTKEIRRINNLSSARCAGKLTGNGKTFLITRAVVYISTDDDFRTRHCLVEEITQVLGLTNDVPPTIPTIFNLEGNDRYTALTPADRFIIRVLYDGRLKPGMSADQAMPIARKVVEDLLARGR